MSIPGGVHRRAVIHIAGVGALLAGCRSGTGDDTDSGGSIGTPAAVPSPSAESPSAESPTGGDVIAKTSDIPVGGGTITAEFVVTQPAPGTYKAFSNVCTHQGCKVAEVADKSIKCHCHNSTFDIATGEPTGGPAPKALAETPVKVSGDGIVRS
jgi:nitrite reductase/ring-hydroxylating ferredoxin subunit